MRIVLVGAVESTRVALEALVKSGVSPGMVVTLPQADLIRHSDAVDLAAMIAFDKTQILYTSDINSSETASAILSYKPDLIFVIGWSQICKTPFRSLAKLGCVGYHPARLPRLRGRAVIPWTILTEEKITGSTLFWLDDGIDSGGILLQETFEVTPDESAESLYTKHMSALRMMVPKAVTLIESGKPPRVVQDHSQATYCARRRPEDGLINWLDSATNIQRLIRAVGAPYPSAYTRCEGQILHIDKAAFIPNSQQFVGLPGQVQTHTEPGFIVRCGDGICLEITSWRWRNGKRPIRHTVLGGDR